MLIKKQKNSDLKEIRSLLFDDEHLKYSELSKKIDELASIIKDKEFIEKKINTSIHENKPAIINSFYPVIGPIIRKSVSEAVRQIIDSIDTIANKAFSFEGIKWRFESLYTGIPLSKIILRNTLVYRVEHIFLINRNTSELLNHLVADKAMEMDKSSFSGLLNAVTDFASEVFSINKKSGCHSLEFDNLNVWVTESPTLYLAIIIRGAPPANLRDKLNYVSEKVHSEVNYKNINSSVKNDPGINRILKPLLEEEEFKGVNKKSNKGLIIFVLLSYLLTYFLIQGLIRMYQKSQQTTVTNKYVHQLIEKENSQKAFLNSFNLNFVRENSVISSLDIFKNKTQEEIALKTIIEVLDNKPKSKDIAILLSYKPKVRKQALRIAREMNWKIHQKGYLNYHIVRPQLTSNMNQEKNMVLSLISSKN